MSDVSNSSSDNSGEISMEKSLRGKRHISTVNEAVEDYHRESHTSSERERRKKIRLYLRELQDLVPSVHRIRADKATIVEETIKYIKTLEDIVEKLEKIKRERLLSASNFAYPTAASSHGSSSMATQRNPIGFQTWIFPNVVVNIFGEDAQFSICLPNEPDLYSDIFCALHKHNIQAKKQHLEQSSEACSFEDTFKKAAGDIHLLSPM